MSSRAKLLVQLACKDFQQSSNEISDNFEEIVEENSDGPFLQKYEKANDVEDAKPDKNKIVAVYDQQAVLPIPSGEVSSFYYKSKLATYYNFTVYNIVPKQGYYYVWSKHCAKRSANEIGTCILNFLNQNAHGKSVIMDIVDLCNQLEKVEEALKCSICNKQCVDPIRVKICGHYFCLKCLKGKEANFCPTCKTFYEEREVDYNNIAKHTVNILLDLKGYLLQPDSNDCKSVLKSNAVEHTFQDETDIFEYKNKKYHVNYIDELFNKINPKEEVEQLIERKVDINVKDFAGWAPLHEAIESGSIEIVETLLKHGALTDIPGEEYITPLHKSVIREDDQLIRLLLRYDADRELIDYFGKKPIDYTRNEKIKSILSEDIITTQRNKEIFCRKKISAYFYYVDEDYKEKLNKSKLAKVVKEFDAKRVTHFIIKKTHKVSLKILVAMLEGCFLVPQEWIDAFLKDQYFIPILNYTFISNKQLNKGIGKAIINSLLKLPKLFDGMFFFVYGHIRPVEIHGMKCTKELIYSLISAGGGKVLHRAPTLTSCEKGTNFPYHSNINASRCCHYIIYEEKNPPILQYQMAEIKHKSSNWLLDCVISFTICK
ncbi:hypothetical protein NQ314_013595 [Rhamnusium bicolor]|uniref:Uncharacterized protein n=1 Tax=Rhamnusium bicolor TaxID=1586634 RepID=A0AAV8X5B5_9CUCU|nr:hypothetical protein NQ314_013595 [Rhamnusium bicolor]